MAHDLDEFPDPGTGTGRARLVPTAARLLSIVAGAAAAIWVVSVVVDVWNTWTQGYNTLPGLVPLHTRLQLTVTAISSPWGYLLVAVVALAASEWLRTTKSE